MGELLQGCRRFLLSAANQALESTLRPKEGASDLVQETFILAQRDFMSFEGESPGELLAWLRRILDHQLQDQVRHYKKTLKRSVDREVPLDRSGYAASRELAAAGASPIDAAALSDEQRRIRLAVERLPDDYRRVLALRTWQRLPLEEVGRQMGRSAEAAGKLWVRAVERLEIELRMVR